MDKLDDAIDILSGDMAEERKLVEVLKDELTKRLVKRLDAQDTFRVGKNPY